MPSSSARLAAPAGPRPAAAAAALLVGLPFLFPLVAGPSVSACQLLASWACVALLLAMSPAALPASALTVLLSFLAVCMAVGGLLSGAGDGLWLPGAMTVVAMFAAACVGAGMAANVRDPDRFAPVAWGMLAAGLFSAVIGLLQYFNAVDAFAPWAATSKLGQAYGNLRQRNQLATLLSMALVALLYVHGSVGNVRARVVVFFSAGTLLAAAAAATTSRTGLLQWILILLLTAFVAWRERRDLRAGQQQALHLPHPLSVLALLPIYFIAAGVLPLAAGIAHSRMSAHLRETAFHAGLLLLTLIGVTPVALSHGQPHMQRAATRLRRLHPWFWIVPMCVTLLLALSFVLPSIASEGTTGLLRRLGEPAQQTHGRVVLWANMLELIAQHPWLGWGWGELGFANVEHLYSGPRFAALLDNAHSLPLHLAVELGLPAALLISGGFAWMVCRARPWAERDADRLAAWGVLGAILLHSMVEYPLWFGPFQLAFGLCLGFLWRSGAGNAAVPAPSSVATGARALAAFSLMGVVAYAAWDYTRVSQVFLQPDQRMPAYRNNAIGKAADSWLFANQVEFARLTLMPLTRDNAREVHDMALRVLHFSPEPRVITKLIESAWLLGRDDEAASQLERFKQAYPAEYARWKAKRPQPAEAPIRTSPNDSARKAGADQSAT